MDDFEELVKKHGSALVVGPYQFLGWKATAVCIGFGGVVGTVIALFAVLIIEIFGR